MKVIYKKMLNQEWRREQWLKAAANARAKMNRSFLVIGVDMDGVLCNGTMYNPDDVMQPNEENIKLVNELYEHNFIVIHTARRYVLMHATMLWLEKHGVRYHAVHFEKMPADLYIDDKCFNPINL